MAYPPSKRLENYRKKLPPLNLPKQNLTTINAKFHSLPNLTTQQNKKGKKHVKFEEIDLAIIDYFVNDLKVSLTQHQKRHLDNCSPSHSNYLQQKRAFLFHNYVQDQQFKSYRYPNNSLEHIEHLYRLGMVLTEKQREDLKLPNKLSYFELERIYLYENFLAMKKYSLTHIDRPGSLLLNKTTKDSNFTLDQIIMNIALEDSKSTPNVYRT